MRRLFAHYVFPSSRSLNSALSEMQFHFIACINKLFPAIMSNPFFFFQDFVWGTSVIECVKYEKSDYA